LGIDTPHMVMTMGRSKGGEGGGKEGEEEEGS
jgi:hypothetical protein